MRTSLFLSGLLLAAPAFAADRNYSVTSFEKVRVEGPYDVRLVTGVAPFARAHGGSLRVLDGVSVKVEGTTLIVRVDRSAWGADPKPAGPVTIEVGTHDLRTASVSGSGSLALDRLRGQTFHLTVLGDGSASASGVDVDEFTLFLSGSGSAGISGRANLASYTVKGTGAIDAVAMDVKDAKLLAVGPSKLSATARTSAEISASGTASVTVTGKPTCTLKARGSATITGC